MHVKEILFALALAACAHGGDRQGTTTVTSGDAPTGVRVTNVTVGDVDPAERLAGELCRREATCGRIEARGSDEAKLLGEQNCVTVETPRARAAIGTWGCNTTGRDARFEGCLAAIRSERCDTRLSSPDTLPLCRANTICAK